MNDLSVSRQQVLGARARFDLASGYPTFRIQPFVAESHRKSLDAVMAAEDGRGAAVLSRGLREATSSLLGLDEVCRAFPTLSGTIALERSLRAAEHLGAIAKKRSVTLMTTDNTIDLARSLVLNRPGWTCETARCNTAESLAEDLILAIDAIGEQGSTYLVVLVTSTNNQDGRCI